MAEIRARQWMFVQDLDHLKVKVDDLSQILENSGCSEWAYILHDKDLDEEGKLIRPHLHVILKFENPQTLKKIAELFKDQPQYVDVWKGRINNAYSYLIHATNAAQDKHKYSPEEVTASFDFNQRIKEIENQISKKPILKSKIIDQFLNKYANREISYEELENSIGIAQVAKRKNVIDHIDQLNAAKDHKKWLAEFQGHRMETHWVWGEAGVGKTRYARWLTRNQKVAVLGSSRDYFQEYHGERFVILNDLRPNDFKYADLLRLLDPFEIGKMAPRRYKDLPLNIEMLIITTPYSPRSFYRESFIDNRDVDTFEQLERRVHEVHLTSEFVSEILPNVESEKALCK